MDVHDWHIQTCWWTSGIFATGAVWYFLSMHEYLLFFAALFAAIVCAGVAIWLHKKKDVQQSSEASLQPIEKDKVVTSEWWQSSELRKQYMALGLNNFCWSNTGRIAEREQQGYEVVYDDDSEGNVRYRIVNKSGQVLIARNDA